MISKDKMTYEALALPHRSNLSDEQTQLAADAHYEKMKQRHSVRQYSTRPVARTVIESCIRTAGSAPSGANHQPWHFVAISNAQTKSRIRIEAEKEEKKFYDGGASDEWIKALEPIGTDASKPHLEDAPWLIVIFAERYGEFDDGTKYKNYYVTESVGIATGFLISALHHAGLVSLTHTPNPMKFLNDLCDRPNSNKAMLILAVGHPADDAKIPAITGWKKPLDEILTVHE